MEQLGTEKADIFREAANLTYKTEEQSTHARQKWKAKWENETIAWIGDWEWIKIN